VVSPLALAPAPGTRCDTEEPRHKERGPKAPLFVCERLAGAPRGFGLGELGAFSCLELTARVGWGYRTAVEALESMSMVLTGPVWQPLMRLVLLASLVSPALIEAAFEAVG
jgi:hypothetical protein